MAAKAVTPLQRATLTLDREAIAVTDDVDVLVDQTDRLSRLTLYVLDGVLCNEGLESEAAAMVLEIAQNAQACAARLTEVYYAQRITELRKQHVRKDGLTPKEGS